MEKKQLLWLIPIIYVIICIASFFLFYSPTIESFEDPFDRQFFTIGLAVVWPVGLITLIILVRIAIKKGKKSILKFIFWPLYKK